MTAFEKFLIAIVVLSAASHAAVRFGKAAGVPAGLVSLAEGLVTT
jgi:hypothetical protein